MVPVVTVTYHCPRCGAIAELERDAYLADRCVTETPLEGYDYAHAYEDFDGRETDRREDSERSSGEQSEPRDADGVEIVCGASETRGEGCGEVYYLSFVKYVDGEPVEPPTSLEDDPNFDFLR